MKGSDINNAIQQFDKEFGREDGMIRLMIDLFPNNTVYSHVLLKVCIINELYSAGIKNKHIRGMAKHIIDIKNIDVMLHSDNKDNLEAFNAISKASNNLDNYPVFASKYCHFHNPDKFPIYDSYSRKALSELSRNVYSDTDLENYYLYKKCIDDFLLETGNKWSYKQIDEFLWLKGKGLLKNSDEYIF